MIYFSSTQMTSGLSVMNTCLFKSDGDGDADRIVCKYFGNPLRACYQKSELFKGGKGINFNLSNSMLASISTGYKICSYTCHSSKTKSDYFDIKCGCH